LTRVVKGTVVGAAASTLEEVGDTDEIGEGELDRDTENTLTIRGRDRKA
jgi:hypothetical protein